MYLILSEDSKQDGVVYSKAAGFAGKPYLSEVVEPKSEEPTRLPGRSSLFFYTDEGKMKPIPYKPGTRGPAEADDLLTRAGYSTPGSAVNLRNLTPVIKYVAKAVRTAGKPYLFEVVQPKNWLTDEVELLHEDEYSVIIHGT
ncbi:Glucose-6-phosphate 1-dehydrogenase, cytoplasmic isoform-like protein [Drosera capensis]